MSRDLTESEMIEEAERRIQRLCLDLEEATGKRLDIVSVDTRNFANCLTEIFLAKPPKPMSPEHAAAYHGDIDGDADPWIG